MQTAIMPVARRKVVLGFQDYYENCPVQENKRASILEALFLWILLGSNQRPSDYESDALTV